MAYNNALREAGAAIFAESQKDGKERAAFLFNGPNGSIEVGPTIVGEKGEVLKGVRAPDDAIRVIHTHPDPAPGIPSSPPSGKDAAYLRRHNIHGIVEQRDHTFYQDWQTPTKYFKLRTKSTEGAPGEEG